MAYTGDTIRLNTEKLIAEMQIPSASIPSRNYKVVYGIPTYTEFDHCRKAVEGIINSSTLVPDKILIIDNSGGAGYDALRDLEEKYNERVFIDVRDENILAGAWNDIMNEHDDYIIVANDDAFPHPHSIQELVQSAIDRPEIAMFNGSGHSGNSYSFFLLRKWAYLQLQAFNGMGFNEDFKGAYFEDNCADYELKLLGLIRETLVNCTFDHIGSATLKNMRDERLVHHHAAFAANQRLYQRMWGGLPGKEQFKKPFERPFFDLADA